MLQDTHGRTIDYVRLAVTDRCNLRCFYCMPHEGIEFLPKHNLLSYEEMLRMLRIMASEGISKVRITGGEPFVRKNLMDFLWDIKKIPGIEKLHLTTNGVLTAPHLSDLKKMSIAGINLSLDSMNRERFFEMTRRDELPAVLNTLEEAIKLEIPLKINAVMMAGKNHEDIFELIEIAKNAPVSVRFIEEMPFNGEGLKLDYFLSYQKIIEIVKERHPGLEKLQDEKNSTSYNYKIPGFKGNFGVIAAYSRTFCGTCNRLRITPTGDLKTCLYDDGVFNIRDMMRSAAEDGEIAEAIQDAIRNKAKDGFEAEKNRKNLVSESMTTIGG
jgi:molybdenum cofactor biosynthesis protein A